MLNYIEEHPTTHPSIYPIPTKEKREALIIPIESRRERHHQRQAEEGAFGAQDEHILMSFFMCETCQVGIGPDHVEQELWLFHALSTTIRINEIPTYFKDAYLRVCGGCAKRYHLPEEHCLVYPEYWLTTILLERDETRIRAANPQNEAEWYAIRTAIDQVVKAGMAAIIKMNPKTTTIKKKRETHDNKCTTAR